MYTQIAYRPVPGDSIWIPLGIVIGSIQIGAFYGLTFSTVQQLVPPEVRSTIVAFYLLVINLVGVGPGVTLAGISIDVMAAGGVEQPYSMAMLALALTVGLAATIIS